MEISTRVDDRFLLGWPVELLDVTIQVAAVQPDVCDDVLLVVQVQVTQQGSNGALSWHCHAQRVAALWMRRVERLHHIIRLSIGCKTPKAGGGLGSGKGVLAGPVEEVKQ